MDEKNGTFSRLWGVGKIGGGVLVVGVWTRGMCFFVEFGSDTHYLKFVISILCWISNDIMIAQKFRNT